MSLASGSESVAPLYAPATIPTSVMPNWTVARNCVGCSCNRSVACALRLPLSASGFSRARRDETMASSDIAKNAFNKIRARTTQISNRREELDAAVLIARATDLLGAAREVQLVRRKTHPVRL